MALITPAYQRFEDLRNGSIIGISLVKLVSTSDTMTVPALANTSASASSAQVRNSNEPAITVTDNGTFTVTMAGGTAGDLVTIITHHKFINNGLEA